MQQGAYNLGMIGLGTMGRNLLLNMADHGFKVAGFDTDPAKVESLNKEGNSANVKGFSSLQSFVESLQKPRAVMLLVPAGKIVDLAIADIAPLLDKGDLIIDGGNSYFADTDRRAKELTEKGLRFLGMGVSGGSDGARKGPSMMPGGDPEAYKVVQPIFQAIAAKVNNDPCVTYVGSGSAGHFVKMVHNGIEYGIMQLIAEAYEVMNKGLQLPGEKIFKVFDTWSKGRLQSFLIEITRDIFSFKEPGADHLLLEDIKDEAKSKGTGKWTSQIAMDLQLPITVIDSSVSMRDLSKYKSIRTKASALYGSVQPMKNDAEHLIKCLEETLYFSTAVAYAQGMHLLSQASSEYQYNLKLQDIALIWRGGCIIRSAFLEDIYQAYKKDNTLPHLLLDNGIAAKINECLPAVREVISSSVNAGIALPCITASLSYFDAFRSDRMPSNLIQAQRDYFGAHTYELVGKEGVFHTEWTRKVIA